MGYKPDIGEKFDRAIENLAENLHIGLEEAKALMDYYTVGEGLGIQDNLEPTKIDNSWVDVVGTEHFYDNPPVKRYE